MAAAAMPRLGMGTQVAIAWTLRHREVVCIPKAGREEHVPANAAVATLRLDPRALEAPDRAFPPPTGRRRLEVI